MSILLLGHWDHGGNLVIDESIALEDGDQESIDALVEEQGDEDGMAWACEFLVDRHSEALREAYATYVEDEGGRIIDEAEGLDIP